MAKNYMRQGALAHLHLEALGVEDPREASVIMCERPFRGQLALRGNARDRSFVAAVEQVLGTGVPLQANRVAKADGIAILWLGPDEWLVVMPDGREVGVLARLRQALVGQHCAVIDVSDSRAIIGFAGPRARNVLMKGCSLDLHPRLFGPGNCAQSGLARCHMLLHQIDAVPTYDVYVHRSFSDYVWRWFEDAAKEYGLTIMTQPTTATTPRSATAAQRPLTA